MAGIVIVDNITDERAETLLEGICYGAETIKKIYRFNNRFVIHSDIDPLRFYVPVINGDCAVFTTGKPIVPGKKLLNVSQYIYTEIFAKGKQLSALPLSGSYGVFVIDKGNLMIRTDSFGFMPIYYFTSTNKTVISSHPDLVNAASGEHSELDMCTAYEVLINWYSIYPYTYYKSVKQFPAGSIIEIIGKNMNVSTYRKIEFKWEGESLMELAEELGARIKYAVQDYTCGLSKVGVFLSSGYDSRVVLENVSSDIVEALIFYDEPNEEFVQSQKMARAIGVHRNIFKRDLDYYFREAAMSAKITGGMWALGDAHFTPHYEEIGKAGYGLLLSGCYADYLFKGIMLDRHNLRFLGRRLGGYVLSDSVNRSQLWGKRYWIVDGDYIPHPYRKDVNQRLAEACIYREGTALTSEREHWNAEFSRLYPISREATTATRLLLSRAFNWTPLLSDERIIEMYERIPPSYKVDGEVWRKAAKYAAPRLSKYANPNTWAKPGDGRVTHIVKSTAAKVYYYAKVKLNPNISIGSWPNFSNIYVNSQRALKMINEMRNEFVPELFKNEPNQLLNHRAGVTDPYLFHQLLMMYQWEKVR